MALLALASSAFQVYAQSNMTVSGKIEGIPSGQLVLVAQVERIKWIPWVRLLSRHLSFS